MSTSSKSPVRKKAGRPPSNVRVKYAPEGWSADWMIQYLKGLPEGDRFSLRGFCVSQAGKSWQVLYKDVCMWRNENEELRLLLRGKQSLGAGAPKKGDRPENADWRLNFIEELLISGNRATAAEKTPYTLRHILNIMNPRLDQYDEHFHKMVEEAEQRIAAEMESGIIQAFRDADEPRDRAWIARSYLERRDPTRWSKQVELIHSGEVAHKHQVEGKVHVDLLATLVQDQRLFMKREPVQLLNEAPVTLEFPAVMEAELVESDQASNAS